MPPLSGRSCTAVRLWCCCFHCFCWGSRPRVPRVGGADEGQGSTTGGNWLRLRSSYGLSQAELGQIDPASETMKMATLGLRGVATNLLWTKADGVQEDRELGQAVRHAESDRQVAAELHQRVGVSGAQPLLQRLGRVRRLSFAIPLGEEGTRVPAGRDQVQPAQSAFVLESRLVHRPQDRAVGRDKCSSGACSARTRISTIC